LNRVELRRREERKKKNERARATNGALSARARTIQASREEEGERESRGGTDRLAGRQAHKQARTQADFLSDRPDRQTAQETHPTFPHSIPFAPSSSSPSRTLSLPAPPFGVFPSLASSLASRINTMAALHCSPAYRSILRQSIASIKAPLLRKPLSTSAPAYKHANMTASRNVQLAATAIALSKGGNRK